MDRGFGASVGMRAAGRGPAGGEVASGGASLVHHAGQLVLGLQLFFLH